LSDYPADGRDAHLVRADRPALMPLPTAPCFTRLAEKFMQVAAGFAGSHRRSLTASASDIAWPLAVGWPADRENLCASTAPLPFYNGSRQAETVEAGELDNQ
jgi:hypothetical protein